MRLVQVHPDWALGFEDEVWWSRLARPALHAWAEADQPVRLVEQAGAPDDPDPKALACYGLLVRWYQPDGVRREATWLRFVEGRPVSAITTHYLAWCCDELARAGKRALLLVWDTRAQPAGQAGRDRRPHPRLLLANQEPLAQSDRAQVGPRQAQSRRARPPADRHGAGRARLRNLRLCLSGPSGRAPRCRLILH